MERSKRRFKPKFPALRHNNSLITRNNQAFSNSLYWQQTDQLQGTDLQGGGGGVLKDRGAFRIGFHPATMTTAGTHLHQERFEAMNGQSVFGDACDLLVLGGSGWLRGIRVPNPCLSVMRLR